MAMRALPNRLLWPLDRVLRGAVRGIAFTGKELHEVSRQARLLLALVAGPFLILLLFGTSYQGEVTRQPTVLVVPTATGLSANMNDYVDAFQFPFTLQSIVRTPAEARALVNAGKASVTALLPDDAWQRIQLGQHPLITVTFDQLEPVRANYLTYYAYAEVNELNRRVLISVLNQTSAQNPQVAGPPMQGYAQQMQVSANQFSNQVRQRDATGAANTLTQMETLTSQGRSDLTIRAQLSTGVQQYFSAPASVRANIQQQTATADQSLATVQNDVRTLTAMLPQALATGQPDARTLADLVANSQKAESTVQALQMPPSDVLASPFQAEINNNAPIVPSFIAFYAPAVLALLLQHVSITLTALTLVRERTSGATELFRVTPSATSEIIFGKFLGYAIIAGLTGAVLFAAMRFALHVPLLGSVTQLVVVIALLIAAALGFGLVISALARSETQAVQYAMLVLLASVFFGNFFVSITGLSPWARVVSYALPITYGIGALQQIMLRGNSANPTDVLALAAFAVGFFVLGTLLFRREIRRA